MGAQMLNDAIVNSAVYQQELKINTSHLKGIFFQAMIRQKQITPDHLKVSTGWSKKHVGCLKFNFML